MHGLGLAGIALLASIGTLGTAGLYVLRPSDLTLSLMRPISLASLFAALGSTTFGAITILTGAAHTATWTAAAASRLLAGCAEALVPLAATLALLALAWLVATVGMLRQSHVA